ncbi:MAG TPA: DUF5677 domain-containing protein [Acidimicrobiales bacterium]|nr:DUF5677 domain-containing protein [Acidimicrobiales bacterium]
MSESQPQRRSRVLSPELLAKVESALQKGASSERFEGLLTDAIDGSAGGVYEALKLGSSRMLAEHAVIREGFERRLQETWRPALESFEVVMVACEEAGSDLHHALHAASVPESGHPIKLHALTLLHARACMVTYEVFALLRCGFAAGAQARWRTLHELAVIANVLGDGDEELSNRFLLHRFVERWKEAQCYQENCRALGREPFSAEEMESFRSDYDEVTGQYESGYSDDWGWSKPLFASPAHRPKFDQLEKLAGLGHNKPFVNLSHHAIHAGASGALDVLELHGGGEVMLAGASDGDLVEPAHGALIAMYQVTVAMVLHGPDEVLPEDLLVLRAIAPLLDDAGDAFADCDSRLLSGQKPPRRAYRARAWARLRRLRFRLQSVGGRRAFPEASPPDDSL